MPRFRISLVGIDLITVEARVVVASIDTYLKYADAVGLTGLVSRPTLGEGAAEGEEGDWVRSGHANPAAGGKAWTWGHVWLRPKSGYNRPA